jgi:hypothetical protein
MMSQARHDRSDEATVRAIMTALRLSYGSLDSPDFREVAKKLGSNPHRPLIEKLRSSGVTVTETTDLNDDVSTQLSLQKGGDQIALELSVVGAFAVLRWWDADGGYRWVVGPEDAPTKLAKDVAQAVRDARLQLLDRRMAERQITMNHTKATMYKALFTDSDSVP